ncbi:MAG: Ig-like domain-containing domain [Tunicatimonas sp.]
MRNNQFWLLISWIVLILAGSCARRGVPTGGEKDTIPPTLVRMIPELEAVNYNGDEIELEFNELIEARNLKKELIITPPVNEYDFFIKKNKLFIDLDETLLDSTTYTFNFGEAIQDLSEGNKATNAVAAFSTGDYIDSFKIQGTIRQLLTQQPVEEAVVTLYETRDTLDAFTGPPRYFAKTDEEGNYTIRYIKPGLYRIYAYQDANSNLKIESNKEPYGFIADTLFIGVVDPEVSASGDSLPRPDLSALDLPITRKNTQPLVLQSSRATGKYYEFKFNKGLRSYSLEVDTTDVRADTKKLIDSLAINTADSTRYLLHDFQDERKVIRVYNTLRQDSLRTVLSAIDSTQQAVRDSVFYIRFTDSRRKPEAFTTNFAVGNDAIEDTIKSEIRFNKPIIRVKTDSILLSYDTLYYLPVNYATALAWNDRLNEVKITVPIDREQLIDSVVFYQQRNDSIARGERQQKTSIYLDSLRAASNPEDQRRLLGTLSNLSRDPSVRQLQDSVNQLEDEPLVAQLIRAVADTLTIRPEPAAERPDRSTVSENLKALNFYAAPGSFMSVEQDSSEAIVQRYTFKNPEKLGTLSGTVAIPYKNYFLQLLNKSYQVVEELKNPSAYTFRGIRPDTYRLRILVDANNNGAWQDGNVLLGEEPEPVLMYPEEIVVRENWEMNDVDVNLNSLFTVSSE